MPRAAVPRHRLQVHWAASLMEEEMTLLTPRAITSINSSILLRFNDASIKCTERSQGINYPIRGVQVPDALIQPVAGHVAETNPIVLSLHALDDQQVSPTALLLHASNHFVRSMLATPCTPDVVAQAPVPPPPLQLPTALRQMPVVASQVAVMLPVPAEQAVSVVQLLPRAVEPQATAHAVALKAPPSGVGMMSGAPLQVPLVPAVQVPLSWPHCPSAWQTADSVPVKPAPQAAALQV